jgi:hypothetical protein
LTTEPLNSAQHPDNGSPLGVFGRALVFAAAAAVLVGRLFPATGAYRALLPNDVRTAVGAGFCARPGAAPKFFPHAFWFSAPNGEKMAKPSKKQHESKPNK